MDEETAIIQRMKFLIHDICEKIGPRPPCSLQETKAAQYIYEELNKYADKAQIEHFTCHPKAYFAQFRLPIILPILASFFYTLFWIWSILEFYFVSFTIASVSVLIIIANIMQNKELIDPCFKTEESTNVYGIFYPIRETRQRVIIGGHHDSNWEFPLIKKNWKLFGFIIGSSILMNYILFALITCSGIFNFFFSGNTLLDLLVFWFNMIVVFIIFPYGVFLCIFTIFFPIVSDYPVMGANDNLTAIAVILALAPQLRNLQLQYTEVWFVSHGCEEIGDRGSKRFVRQHLNELKEATLINLDMIGGKNTTLHFITSELMFFVKLSENLAKRLAEIAQKMEIPYQLGRIEAFTDAMAYAKRGIRACSIVGLPQKGVTPTYHTRDDVPENITFENLWNCYSLLMTFLKAIDSGLEV
ncbi:MAG: M28 family metallopeptidase [Candidatus Helarchaeota archaeon]